MWRGVTGSLGPCGGQGIAGMAVRSQWHSWAARVYRGAVMMWWACPSRTMWRSVPKSFGRWAAGVDGDVGYGALVGLLSPVWCLCPFVPRDVLQLVF